jgi:hypothetical protein
MATLHYPRHFAFLTLAVALLTALSLNSITRPGGPFQGLLYGALHGIAIVGALKDQFPSRTRASFIVEAGVLGLFAPYVVMLLLGCISAVTGPQSVAASVMALLLGSAACAAAYAELLRRNFAFALTRRTIAQIAIACGVASAAANRLGYPDFQPQFWLTIIWWFAFSGSLWLVERNSKAPNNALERERGRQLR